MSLICHITNEESWKQAQKAGFYETPSLKLEGFIHCCEPAQSESVIKRYYHDKPDLVKLFIDTEKLTSQLVYEWSPTVQDTFPHIYGPINLDAVVDTEKLEE